MAAAGRLERARRVVAALEAALALEEEEGDVPARVLVEHIKDGRRRRKLLLAQLRVLRLLLRGLGRPGPPPAPPAPRAAEARGRWRGLKGGYGGAVAALGGALPPALAQLGRGRRLLRGLRGALGARLRQKAELEAKVREATERRDELRRRVAERRRAQQGQQEALRRRERAAQRAEAGCRLHGTLAGVRVLPPAPGSPGLQLEVGPPPGLPDSLPAPRLRRSPGGGLRLLGPAPPLPPPLGPGLLELQRRCWDGRPLWAEVEELQRRFALDWEPELGRVRVLGGTGGSESVWTLELAPGYPRAGGGVRLLAPPGGGPPPTPPSAAPTLRQWLELLVGAPPEGGAPPPPKPVPPPSEPVPPPNEPVPQ